MLGIDKQLGRYGLDCITGTGRAKEIESDLALAVATNDCANHTGHAGIPARH